MQIGSWHRNVVALAVVGLLGGVARAESPQLTAALAALKTAQTQLTAAKEDKDGHRTKALASLKTTLAEVEAAIAADKATATPPVVTPPGPPVAVADAKATAAVYKAKCASCHGPDGKAKTKTGEKLGIADMTVPAWQKSFTDAQLKENIEKGLKRDKNGKKQTMPGFASKLKPEQIAALVAYVRGLGGK